SEATLEGLPDIGYLYDMVEIGWSYEMSELSAAVCLERLRRLPQAIKRRKEIAKMYHESLVDVEHVKMITPLDGDNIAHFFVEIDKNRDHFARELKKEGIDVRLHYIPLNFMDYYKKKYNLKVFDFSTALSVYQKTLSLPLFDGMIDSEVQKVCTAVQQVAKSYM
ncbi:MAG TPA: aminotransferase DegT, partial [Epsilonproteobacteria bacterium]|nr:aminotransferase DegT [Campylobacterota bacterium]